MGCVLYVFKHYNVLSYIWGSKAIQSSLTECWNVCEKNPSDVLEDTRI